jgi:RsiW-degrading membrane proteinase PrsW (M82 family)
VEAITFIAIIVVPALFWGGYLYYRDRHRPEPITYKGITFLLGFAAGALALKSYDLLEGLGFDVDVFAMSRDSPWHFYLFCVGVIGTVEEAPKLLLFVIVCTRFRHFDEEMDGLIYASALALGFAAYENTLLLSELDGSELLARSITSPLVHTIFASIWGVMIGRAHLAGKPILLPSIAGLCLAAIAHGTYDYLTMTPLLSAASSLVILVLWIWRIVVMKRLHAEAVREQPLQR